MEIGRLGGAGHVLSAGRIGAPYTARRAGANCSDASPGFARLCGFSWGPGGDGAILTNCRRPQAVAAVRLRPQGRDAINGTVTLIHLVGAIALLLWGMRMVRTGVGKAFGADLRRLVGHGAGGRLSAFAAGVGVTAVMQSSTATALMTASFASRGLMATAIALAIMLGADVGSSLVAQVLSVDIGWLSPAVLAVGVAFHLGGRRMVPRQIGRAAIGLGLMLLALKLIVAASSAWRESPTLRLVLAAADEQLILVMAAALLTWLAHSSLAMVLLVMSLADSGTLPAVQALVVVLGVNLGAGLPALTDTLHEPPEARRVAFANACFRALACLAALPLLDFLQPGLAALGPAPGRQVVNFHLAFNLGLAGLFLPLVGPAAWLAERLFPSLPEDLDPGRPRHLDRSAVASPEVALACAARETLRMGDLVETMLRQTLDVLRTDDRELAVAVARMDNAVDRLHEEIKLYVTAVTRESLDEPEGRRAAEILAFTTNLEHVGDIVDRNLMELAAKKIKHKLRFSDDGFAEIAAIHAKVVDDLKLALGVFMSRDVRIARRLMEEKERLVALDRAAAEAHLARLREGRPETIQSSALHLDVLRDLRRIHSHLAATAYPVLEEAGQLRKSRLKKLKPAENGATASVADDGTAAPAA
jgi:phosphate:Na+ symporter